MTLTIGTPDSATIGGTEYSLPADSTTLAAQTDDCHLYVNVDWNAVAAGDLFRLRVYEKIDGTNQRVIFERFVDAPIIDPPYDIGPVGTGWDVTVIKLAGTDRAIAWRLDKDTGASGGGGGAAALTDESFELEYGQAVTLRGIPLYATDGTLYTSALSSGDVKIYKNGGTGNDLGTLPSVSVGSTHDVVLTAAELQTTQAVIEFKDQDGPAFVPRVITIRTWGHPSAFDPQGVILAGTAQTTGTTASVVRLANGQEPEAGQDIEFVAGPWLGRRVIAEVEDMGSSNFQVTLDRAAPVSLDNTSRYRISGGSLPTSVEEFQLGLATDSAVSAMDTKVDALLAAAEVYKRATAVTAFAFYMELTAGGPATGKTVTVQVSKDGGAFGTVAGAVTEIGSGWYEVDLSGTDMDADEIAFKATATDSAQRNLKIRTQT